MYASATVLNISPLRLYFDAIASSIGMYLIANKFTSNVHIIVDEDPVKIEAGVKKIINAVKKNISVISLDKYKQLSGNDDVLVAVDVNKSNLLCCSDCVDNFKDIIVIDHHNEDEKTLNSDAKFVVSDISSTSEIVAELLGLYQIKYDSNIANYLLSGIYLDTNKFTKNASSKTMKLVSKLLERGADLGFVNDLFEEDYASDRKVQDLVGKTNFFTYVVGICCGDELENYTKEELAKAADYLLKYKVDAAFALGSLDEKTISISARSKGKVDAGFIMQQFGGGGNLYSAASKITDEDLPSVHKRLEKVLKPDFYKA